MTDRLLRERHLGIDMPESFLQAPRRILLWRALVAGERFSKHAAAARFQWHLSTADDALCELHAQGKVHIVGWTRNGDRGPLTKVVAFGPGDDLPRPEKLSAAFACKRWRGRHPERAEKSWRQARLKKAIRNGALPKGNDPLLFAIMGAPA